MELDQIERWAFEVIARVKAGQPLEDTRVELKATWIEPVKAAWRIAAQANAAYGANILWLMGADEDKGVCGVAVNDFATWYRQVSACFDEDVYPTVSDMNLTVDSVTVVALVFDTRRAPYLVRNQDARISRVVAWRSGTSLRCAYRSELLSMLSRAIVLPSCEVVRGWLGTSYEKGEEHQRWTLSIALYFQLHTSTHLILPVHRLKASLNAAFISVGGRIILPTPKGQRYDTERHYHPYSYVMAESEHIAVTEHDVTLKASGPLIFECSVDTQPLTAKHPFDDIWLNIL